MFRVAVPFPTAPGQSELRRCQPVSVKWMMELW